MPSSYQHEGWDTGKKYTLEEITRCFALEPARLKGDHMEKKVRQFRLIDIPSNLWDKVKHAAINEHLTLRDLVIKALKTYLKEI
jgi:hypothetical protein